MYSMSSLYLLMLYESCYLNVPDDFTIWASERNQKKKKYLKVRLVHYHAIPLDLFIASYARTLNIHST